LSELPKESGRFDLPRLKAGSAGEIHFDRDKRRSVLLARTGG